MQHEVADAAPEFLLIPGAASSVVPAAFAGHTRIVGHT